jgi:exopolyphosphatase/guanosine-5'-triphosphate,3'-diphosphate pyrophosphatase
MDGVPERVGAVTVAALDVGSNSFHLLVVQATADGSMTVLERRREMVRLGESSLHDGVISRTAFRRGLRALRLLTEAARRHTPDTVVAVATSAVREASNGRIFLEAARRLCGLSIRIIDGAEESRLIYLGVRRALQLSGARRMALFDVGGGSTDAILGNEQQALISSSLKIGVLRLRDHWQRADQSRPGDTRIMAEWVRTVITPTIQRFRTIGFDGVALTSGTALALARLAGRRLPAAGGIDRFDLGLDDLREWEERLSALTLEERGHLPGLDPRRADTIVPGTVILRSILEVAGVASALVCDAALREGLAAEHLPSREAAPLPWRHQPVAAARAERPSGAHAAEAATRDGE